MSHPRGSRHYRKVRGTRPGDKLRPHMIRILDSQFEWCMGQPGGFSTTVRRLIKEAIWKENLSIAKRQKIDKAE